MMLISLMKTIINMSHCSFSSWKDYQYCYSRSWMVIMSVCLCLVWPWAAQKWL